MIVTRLPGLLACLVLLAASHAPAQEAQPAAAVLFPEVTDVDHAGLIRAWNDQAFERARKSTTANGTTPC